MQISDVVGSGRGQLGRGPVEAGEAFPFARIDSAPGCCVHAEIGELGWIQEQFGVTALQLDRQLVDIGVAPAEAGRQRQRHRPGASVDCAEEAGGELRAGLGDKRDPVARRDTDGDEALRMSQRILAQLGIRISARQRPARIVEVESAAARRRIIECLAERREVGEAAGKRIDGRCRARRRKLVLH